MIEIIDKTLDEERALYGLHGAHVSHCTFAGPADGESALKECRDLDIEDSQFDLRYPLWHVIHAKIQRVSMSQTCRAALWYDEDLDIADSTLGGIKALRECDRTKLVGCDICSAEFGWFCRDIEVDHCDVASEYLFLKCRNLQAKSLKMKGKYSFQYLDGGHITDSELDTKDAFWHSRNVTVSDSLVKGEYLGWYSENLTLERCHLVGTQPLCYAKGLKLIDCTTDSCDLAFEKSQVEARIIGRIESIKAPESGSHIEADDVGAWLDEN